MGSAGVGSHEEVSSHSAAWSSCSARMNLHSVELNSYAGGEHSAGISYHSMRVSI